MTKKPIHIEIVEENDERVILTVDADGRVRRVPVDGNKKSTRKPRKHYARAWSRKTRSDEKEKVLKSDFGLGVRNSHEIYKRSDLGLRSAADAGDGKVARALFSLARGGAGGEAI